MLYYFRADAFFASSGREMINGFVFDSISKNPLLGVGVGPDRILVFQGIQNASPESIAAAAFGNLTINDVGGCYAHNLFVELILQFGVPFGLIISGFLIALIVVSIKMSRDTQKSVVLIFIGFSKMCIRDRNYNIAFFIFGDGIERAALEKRCEVESIDNVHFFGKIDKRQIPSALAQGDVYKRQVQDRVRISERHYHFPRCKLLVGRRIHH